jgi:hypothetical protein
MIYVHVVKLQADHGFSPIWSDLDGVYCSLLDMPPLIGRTLKQQQNKQNRWSFPAVTNPDREAGVLFFHAANSTHPYST